MRTIFVVFMVASMTILDGCGRSTDEEAGQPAATVQAVTVAPTTMRPTLDLIGSIVAAPERTATLSSQIAGQIGKVCVVEGQPVKKGEPIVILDARQAEAELGKAKAAVEEARANLEMLEKGPLPAEIEAVRQEARNASATAEARRAKLKALEALHEKGEIADVQYQIARAGVAEAEAMGQAATQRLKTMEMGTRPEMVAQAKAKLAAAESELAAQQLNVDLCTIAAPFDGVVTQLPARLGAYIEKPTVLATVADLSSIFARVRVPANFMLQLQEGITAHVVCDAVGAAERAGVLARIGKEANPGSGDVDAMVQIDNADALLRPGLPCRVRLSLPEIADAIAVPVSAVADRNGVTVVTVIRDGKAYETPVETGVRTNDAVQITKGISSGDLVATEGGYGLPEACPVNVKGSVESVQK